MDIFFGTDYHSHLGTKRGGICIRKENGFNRAIHNIQNSAFRSKFEGKIEDMHGNSGIGSISDSDPQPLTVRSHNGEYTISTVGRRLVLEPRKGSSGYGRSRRSRPALDSVRRGCSNSPRAFRASTRSRAINKN